ncbi:MAG: N-acetyltransferase [Hyphomicrobiales bacterium]|nr:N-acetyltransferase [Hyphomicrobiales bacterium]
MNAAPTGLKIRVVGAISDVPAAAWDALANPRAGAAPDGDPASERYNPFVAHGFLRALEVSRSVGGKSGWTPAHVLVEDAAGALVGAAPTYVKAHSFGEYVFDHAFADAYARAGGRYYPKLQVAAPFTPVGGPRLLTAATGPAGAVVRAKLIEGLRALRGRLGASSIHVTFGDAHDAEALDAAGFLARTGEQFHFFDEGYRDFEGFLAALASRKRKAIRKERAAAMAEGIVVRRLTGADLREAHWDAFFEFYMETGSRKWGRPYLTRDFFSELGAAMADRVLLVMAERDGRPIAGALNLVGDDALYGRNWGAVEHVPFLHFELCYHQAIEFALERGLKRVEAGAQGEHKLARGYRPVATRSAHEFADPRLARAVAAYLAEERPAVEAGIEAYEEATPFKRG